MSLTIRSLTGGARARPARLTLGPAAPGGQMLLLIGVTLLARLMLAGAMGLGIDESYMAAAGRHPALSYFDHPPVAWWLTWLAEQAGGVDNDVAIRLPFIALFALSTWLMFRLTAALFDECAGFWAAAAFNAAPVFGVAAGGWVLPDGPLLAALLGGVLFYVRATVRSGGWRDWIAGGLCFGVALCSKYTALPILLGLGLHLLSTPPGRAWLRRPQPYVAAALALAALTPVLVWNMQHGFASFRFQGGRALGGHFHPFGPLTTLGGEALFFLPWLFAPLLLLLWRALRAGPADPRGWLLVCLSLPSFLLLELVSLQSRVMFHWAAPALMFALPLLGAAIARHWTKGSVRAAVLATGCLVPLGVGVAASEVRYNWLPDVLATFAQGADPDLTAVDWESLSAELDARNLLRPGMVVGAVRWLDAGKIDYALKGRVPVICLGDDPRQYGFAAPVTLFQQRDVLILAPRETRDSITRRVGALFDGIDALPPVPIRHAGRPAMLVPAFLGHRLHAAAG